MFEDQKNMIFHEFDRFPRSFMAKTGLFKNPIHLINVVAQYFLSNRDLHSQYQNTQAFFKRLFQNGRTKKGLLQCFGSNIWFKNPQRKDSNIPRLQNLSRTYLDRFDFLVERLN